MDANRWSRINELFDAAYEVAPEARKAYLKEAAKGDEALFKEVWSLLHEDQYTHSLLDGVALDAIAVLDDTSYEGHRIGPYQIERELGHGGMGRVFLAHRADGEFEQQVALKLIKRGMDSEAVLHRFRSERQILARLQHPHIARLLDGGLTDEGQPYFAMEYVEGQPIDAYCDAHHLTIDERLALFQDVCRAVLYAHAQLVVHRDLKPSNILVMDDAAGRPQVKLLDFGIAKMLADDEEGLTQTGAAVMTPEYASPEQVRGEAVSTATDIYSLGVVLYELLAGHRPYEVSSRNPVEMAQVVLSTEPERPSTAVDRPASDTTAEAISRARGTVVERLRRRLAGDLDVICLKALRKDLERRYLSVEALAEDVRRHLAGLPVEARADTAVYRMRKFAERHRTGVVTTVGVVLLVSALVGFYTLQLKQERDRAQLEAQKATEVAAFLESIFAVSDPGESKGETVTARALLDEGAQRIEDELSGQPEVQAEMMGVVGTVYQSLGLYNPARDMLEKALALQKEIHGEQHAAVAQSYYHLAVLGRRRGEYEGAEELHRNALAIRQQQFGEDHIETAESFGGMASLLHDMGRFDEAENFYRRAIAALEDEGPAGLNALAANISNLGGLKMDQGDYDEAETLYRRALTLRRTLHGERHPQIATSLGSLATLMHEKGDYPAAESLYSKGLAMDRALLGEAHPDVATSMNNLAILLYDKGDFAVAESLYREVLAMRLTLLGEAHPAVATSMKSLAMLLDDVGRDDEAEGYYRRALALRRTALGEGHNGVAEVQNGLAGLLRDRGDYATAASLYQQVRSTFMTNLGEDHPYVAMITNNLAGVEYLRGDVPRSEQLYQEALTGARQALPAEHIFIGQMLIGFGSLLVGENRLDTAKVVLQEARDILRASLPADHWRIAEVESLMGERLLKLKQFGEAEPLLVDSYERLRAAKGTEDLLTSRTLASLVALYEAWGRSDKVGQYRALQVTSP